MEATPVPDWRPTANLTRVTTDTFPQSLHTNPAFAKKLRMNICSGLRLRPESDDTTPWNPMWINHPGGVDLQSRFEVKLVTEVEMKSQMATEWHISIPKSGPAAG